MNGHPKSELVLPRLLALLPLLWLGFLSTGCLGNEESQLSTPLGSDTPSTPAPTLGATKTLPRLTSTATPAPPTLTMTVIQPTNAPTQTRTFTSIPVLLTEPVTVGIGGFSFRPVQGYLMEINVAQTTLSDQSGNFLLSMSGITPPHIQPIEDLLASFLGNVAGDAGNFKASPPYPYSIGSLEGLAADIQGILFDRPFTGRVVVALPPYANVFYMMGIGLQDNGNDHWQLRGAAVFEAIAASIEFFEPTDSACPVSDDPTYGYTTQNPVRVGGGPFGGPAREKAYLDNLRGPNFEPVQYERIRSESYAETILDLYQVTYPGQAEAAWLYLDEYTYQEPKAPRGFKCPQPFNLPPP